MEESAPALVSTMTLWPASTSAFTPEGTIPTRDSWSFTSFGTPINMMFTCFLDASFYPARSPKVVIPCVVVIPSEARDLLFLFDRSESRFHARNDNILDL